MDKLTKALREDAERVQVVVSPDLDKRLRATVENLPARTARPRTAARPLTRIGWASALTGGIVAAAVVLVVNIDRTESPAVAVPQLESVTGALPRLNAEAAVFTAPLTEELENLEADFRKAEQAVKREMGLDM